MKPIVCVAVLCASTLTAQDAQNTSDRFYQAIRNDVMSDLRTLVKDAGPNFKDKRGTTPLMYAAAVGSVAAMNALVDAGADVNAKNAFDVTALMWCATDLAKVKLLLDKGANVNARSQQGRSSLLIAAGTEGNSAVVQMLLDHGADLKKADADPVTTPLAAAAGANDTATLRLLLDRQAEVRGPSGAFALMNAAGHGNIDMMRMLLSKGVPVDVVGPPSIGKVKNGDIGLGAFTPLILAAAYGGPDAVKLLLDAKANVNAQDARGMTPLMMALALDHSNPRVVKLLLERGADPTIKSKTGETALDWAKKFNHPEMLKALSVPSAPVTVSLGTKPVSLKPAIQKGVDLLQRTSGSFFVEGGCASCHSHNIPSMALEVARTAGVHIDEAAAAAQMQQTRASWAPQEQTLMLRMDAPGGHNMVANAVLEFAAGHAKPGPTTDALVHNIAAQQQLDGSWHSDGIARPPMLDGDFTSTALAIRALALYGPPGRKSELTRRIALGAEWLRKAAPLTTEDFNMQVLGLKWAGAASGETNPIAKKIAALQRADGGWGQTAHLSSDAYATGESLYVLREGGVPASDPAYRKGVEFLLRTQLADGSWHVRSRAPKFQPYFQSGFPHDHDQWISMTATAWATIALSYALPEKKMTASAR